MPTSRTTTPERQRGYANAGWPKGWPEKARKGYLVAKAGDRGQNGGTMRGSRRFVMLMAALLMAGAVVVARVSASGPAGVLNGSAVAEQAATVDRLAADVVTGPPAAPTAATAPIFSCRPCRVGLQIGHWQAADAPDELADLRDQTGGDFGPFREIDVNVPVVRAAAELLRQAGVTVDVLPASVPAGYQAGAFVAVHSDRDMQQRWRGYKVAASALSANAAGGKLLASDLASEYGAASGLPTDVHRGAITPGMRFYYAFNTRRFQHAIAATVPAAIIEMGFVSDPADRELLFGHPGVLADALARGIERFLGEAA